VDYSQALHTELSSSKSSEGWSFWLSNSRTSIYVTHANIRATSNPHTCRRSNWGSRLRMTGTRATRVAASSSLMAKDFAMAGMLDCVYVRARAFVCAFVRVRLRVLDCVRVRVLDCVYVCACVCVRVRFCVRLCCLSYLLYVRVYFSHSTCRGGPHI
jgi:hypothetical protein